MISDQSYALVQICNAVYIMSIFMNLLIVYIIHCANDYGINLWLWTLILDQLVSYLCYKKDIVVKHNVQAMFLKMMCMCFFYREQQ